MSSSSTLGIGAGPGFSTSRILHIFQYSCKTYFSLKQLRSYIKPSLHTHNQVGSFSTNWFYLYYICPASWNNSEMLSEIEKVHIFIPIDYAISCDIKQNRVMNFTVWFLRHFPTAYFSTFQRPNGTRPIAERLQNCQILLDETSITKFWKNLLMSLVPIWADFIWQDLYWHQFCEKGGLKYRCLKLWTKGILRA